jgi:single-strand DNA-binding protein
MDPRNNAQLIGRLTKDPEVKQTANDKTVAVLRLAIDGMARGIETGYIDVETWGKPAEACGRVLAKGWLVSAAGPLSFEEWETDGNKRTRILLGPANVQFLAAPRGAQDDSAGEPANAAARDGEDIPF